MERDTNNAGPSVFVWLVPEQIELVRHVAATAGLRITRAGSPLKGQSGAVATALGVPTADDLRIALANEPADLAWIAAAGSFGAEAADDTAAVQAASARGLKVATLEPIPASALDLAAGGWASSGGIRPVDAIRFLPLARLSASFREAAEVLEPFGPIRAMSLESWCAPADGSLGARLFGAMELVLSLMGEPETIDAQYVGPAHGRGVHALPGETLRDLHGDMTANLRFADGRAVALALSDNAGRWNRTVTLLGPGGRLRIFDDGFEWIGPGGEKVDESRPARRSRGAATPPHAVLAIAESLNRLLDPSVPEPAPLDYAAILAMGQAALLSARTGQCESPATIARMASVV